MWYPGLYQVVLSSMDRHYYENWINNKVAVMKRNIILSYVLHVQSTLVISTSVVSNNRLSGRENVIFV